MRRITACISTFSVVGGAGQWCEDYVTASSSRFLCRSVSFDLSRLPKHIQREFEATLNASVLKRSIVRHTQGESSDVPVVLNPDSRLMVSWKCDVCSFSWSARIHDRTDNRTASMHTCPNCTSNRPEEYQGAAAEVGQEETTSATRGGDKWLVDFPLVAADWDEVRNIAPENRIPYGSIDEVEASSPVSVWWKCGGCCVSWQEPVFRRIDRYKQRAEAAEKSTTRDAHSLASQWCPRCEERCVPETVRSQRTFLSDHPLLMLEVQLKPDQDPTKMRLSDAYALRWKCAFCACQFSSPLNDRALRGARCPECSGSRRHRQSTYRQVRWQRPDVMHEVAAGNRHNWQLQAMTTTDDHPVTFVCRTCAEPYTMTMRQRCLAPAGTVVCPKCRFAVHRQLASGSISENAPVRNKRKDASTMRVAEHRLIHRSPGVWN